MKILLAVDGSEFSGEAVKAIAQRPWPVDSTVRVLHAIEPAATPPVGEIGYAGIDLDAMMRQDKQEGEQLLAGVAASLNNMRVETVLRTGSPSPTIVEEAREWQADLIVVGSHGYTGLKRLVLGSVAQSVVGDAPCSVEVVRRKETAA